MKNAIVLYPPQLISDTVKLSCQSANQPIETREELPPPEVELPEGGELGAGAAPVDEGVAALAVFFNEHVGAAHASGSIVKRKRLSFIA